MIAYWSNVAMLSISTILGENYLIFVALFEIGSFSV